MASVQSVGPVLLSTDASGLWVCRCHPGTSYMAGANIWVLYHGRGRGGVVGRLASTRIPYGRSWPFRRGHPPIDGCALSMGEQTPTPRIPSSRIPSYRRRWPVCGDCTTGEGRGMGCYSNTLLAAVTVPVDTGSTARQCTTMHCMMRTFHREESEGVRNLQSRHIA